MVEQQNLPAHLTGGSFLFNETKPDLVFTPEDLGSDEREMAATAESLTTEVDGVATGIEQMARSIQPGRPTGNTLWPANTLLRAGRWVPAKFGCTILVVVMVCNSQQGKMISRM